VRSPAVWRTALGAALTLAPIAAALTLAPIAAALTLAPIAAVASVDSFTPITMNIGVTPIARLGAPLPVKVSVKADPGVLDTADGPLRVEVKLAGECGGNFETTTGVTLVNAPLNPQPTVGRAYSGGASGSGRPVAYGTRTVCTYLEDTGSGRVYANDESVRADITPACTSAGLAYDRAYRSLRAAQRSLRHARTRAARRRDRRLVAGRQRTLAGARHRGVAVCGSGVAL
jgi:hypothetical protein